SQPQGLAIDSDGNVYVSEYGNDRIQVFGRQGRFLRKWGREGNGDGEFSQPQGLAIDSDGDVYVSDQGNHRILVFKPTV
ncbi:MAG: 6-bladed beta-propeller, partial [Chloroflexi bacterium]